MKAEIFLRPENESALSYMKYGGLVVFIRNDSTETWGFRYGLTLVFGTLKIMAGTGVFVRVVCSLKHSIKSFSSAPSIIFTSIEHKQSHSHQKWAQIEIFTRGGNAQTSRPPTENSGKFDKI